MSTAGFGQAKGRRRDREREAVFEAAEQAERDRKAEAAAVSKRAMANSVGLREVGAFKFKPGTCSPLDNAAVFLLLHVTGVYLVSTIDAGWNVWQGNPPHRTRTGEVRKRIGSEPAANCETLEVGALVEFADSNVILCEVQS